MATRVLIVDDHPLTRGALTALLEQNGFDVAGEAASGEDAIEVARELQPDLILLDLSMPGIGGLGALPLLRGAVPGWGVGMLTASVPPGHPPPPPPPPAPASLSPTPPPPP